LVFEERRKQEYPEKKLQEQRRKPTTSSTHTWRKEKEKYSIFHQKVTQRVIL